MSAEQPVNPTTSPYASSYDWEYRPLNPALGAEVVGLDLARELSDDEFGAIRRAWNAANGLLVLRHQTISVEQHLAFARRFGPLFGEADHFQETVHKYLLPGNPAIYRVSNKTIDGQPQGRARAGTYWHSDVSFRKYPAMASLLYAIELPSNGGDTLFASLSATWDSLSEGLQSILEPLDAVHDFKTASGNYWRETITTTDLDGQNRFIHPVVITHPETGRRALFINPGFVAGIKDFSAAESQVLLNYLYERATAPEHVYRHRWQPNDLVIWDNRAMMHYAVSDYTEDRYLHRATVIAQQPTRL